MEKLCYLWWPREDADSLGSGDDLARALATGGVLRPTVHMTIDAPSGAPRAVITAWIDCHDRRTPLEECLATKGGRVAGYLVTESVYIDRPSTAAGAAPDGPAASRLALIERPAVADEAGWLDRWPGALVATLRATAVLRYVRNVVARPLSDDAPPYFLLIEERWPAHHEATPPLDDHSPVVLEASEHHAPPPATEAPT